MDLIITFVTNISIFLKSSFFVKATSYISMFVICIFVYLFIIYPIYISYSKKKIG
jgi:hypothetical protein